MARWLVKLEGDPFDLEEYIRWFPSGDAYALALNNETFLTGRVFNDFNSAQQVREVAIQVLDDFSSVIALLWTGLKRASIGSLILEDESDGSRTHFVFIAESVTARSKVGAVLLSVSSSGESVADSRTQAQQLLEASRTDRRLKLVLSIWADPIRSWPRLYRLLEELEAFLGERLDVRGLCTKSERERFTHSANSAEIAGKDARHRDGKYDQPKNPMALEQATNFIGHLIIAVLRTVSEVPYKA